MAKDISVPLDSWGWWCQNCLSTESKERGTPRMRFEPQAQGQGALASRQAQGGRATGNSQAVLGRRAELASRIWESGRKGTGLR